MKRSWRRDWWWAALFCFVTISIYLHAMQDKRRLVEEFSCRLGEKQTERLLALAEREDLSQRIDSQSDPNWIEMILMRDLGVVPEGWLKVHFIQ